MTAVSLPDAAFEPNDSIAEASPVTLDFAENLFLTPYDVDLFKFAVQEAQIVNVTAEPVGPNDSLFLLEYALYDAAEQIHGATEYQNKPFESYLTPGTYYLKVGHRAFEDNPGAYKVSVQAKPPPDSRYEPNDAYQQATRVTPGFSDTLYLGRGDEDWFALDVQNAATLEVADGTNLRLFDSLLNPVANVADGERFSAEVQPGRYYLKKTDPYLSEHFSGRTGYMYSLEIKLSP